MPAFLLLISLSIRPDAAVGPLAELFGAGRTWLLITVLCVWADDTFAYIGGRLWGRGQFLNHISPNKTWSGAAAGSVAAIVAGAGLGLFVGQPLVGAGLGMLVALMAPSGDLAESAMKRAAGVKDSGRLFPGHGGILDRTDAFLLAAPAACAILTITVPLPEPLTRVAVLGSTGSIGRQALDVLEGLRDSFRVVAMAAGSDDATLSQQARRHRPMVVHLADDKAADRLELPAGTKLVGGEDALTELALRDDVDLVLVATGGMVSLVPVIAALRAGKVVATANKETLVAGGHLVMPLARELATGRGIDAREGDPVVGALAWLRPIEFRSTPPSGSASLASAARISAGWC